MNLTNFNIGDSKAQRIASSFIDNNLQKGEDIDVKQLKKEYHDWMTEDGEKDSHYGSKESVKEFMQNYHEDHMHQVNDLCDIVSKSFEDDDYFEKGGKLNTSHLVLKEVNVNGKMMHRWVDPNKGNREHAEHGSKVELEHKGSKVTGTVGSVGKTGEYAIKLDKEHGGQTINKHPHQFDSPHGEGSKKQEEPKHSPEDLQNFAKKASRGGLENTIKTTKDENIKKIAEKELESRGDKKDGESEEKDKDNPLDADAAADKIVGEKKADEAEEGRGDINRRFDTFARFVRSVASGKGGMKSVISYGTGGVGKTYTVQQELKKLGKREFKEGMEVGSDDYDYVKITGKATTAGLYQAMYEHNGKILMIDDCDTAITDTDEGLWKGALDTSGDGTVAYASQRPLKDSFGQPIPNRFNFNGRAVFISNLPPNKVPQPLKSRSLRVDMTMTPDETIQRIRHIAQHPETKEYNNIKFQGSDGKDIKYDQADLKDAIDFLDKYKNKTNDLNIRTVGSLLDIIHGAKEDGVDWVHDAKDMVLFSKSNSNEIIKALGDLGVDVGDNGEDYIKEMPVVEVERDSTDDYTLSTLISRMHETEVWLKWVHLKTASEPIHEAFGEALSEFDSLTDTIAEQLLGLVGKDKFNTMIVMVNNKQSYSDSIDPNGVAEHIIVLAFDVENYAEEMGFIGVENLAQEMYSIGAKLKYKLQFNQ